MRGFKQFVVVLFVVMLLSFSAVAETSSANTVDVDAGIGPNSMFWFMDRFWENVQLSFTFNEEKKIERYNEIMLERALEAQDMMLSAHFEEADEAEHEYRMTAVLLSNYFDEVKDDMSAEENVRVTMFSEYIQALLANKMEEEKARVREELKDKVTEEKIDEVEQQLNRFAEESRTLSDEVKQANQEMREERPEEFQSESVKSLEKSLGNRYNIVLVVPEPQEKIVTLEGSKIALENNKNCHLLPEQIQVGYDLSAYKAGDKYSYDDVLSIVDMIVEQGKKANDAEKKAAYYDVAIGILEDVNARYGGDLSYWLAHTTCPEKKTYTTTTQEKNDDDKGNDNGSSNTQSALDAQRQKAKDMLSDAEDKISELSNKIDDAQDDGKNTDDAETYLSRAETQLTFADKAYEAEEFTEAYTYADQAYEYADSGLDDDNFGLDTAALADDIDETLQEFQDDVGAAWDYFQKSKEAEYDCDRDGDCDSNDVDDYEADWDDGDTKLNSALDAISGGDDSLEEMMLLYAENLDSSDRDDYLSDLQDLYDEFKDDNSDFEIEIDGDDMNYYAIYDSDTDSKISDLEDRIDAEEDEQTQDDLQSEVDAYEEIEKAYLDYYSMLDDVIGEIEDMD